MIRHAALTALGVICLTLGAIGVFIPIWPTTPFVLLAAGCFSANPRLQAGLMSIKFFGDHVKNYKERTGLTKSNVICSVGFLWTVLILSMLLTQRMWATLLMLSVGVAVTIHVLCMARPKKARQR